MLTALAQGLVKIGEHVLYGKMKTAHRGTDSSTNLAL